jgi:hypothetical protein
MITSYFIRYDVNNSDLKKPYKISLIFSKENATNLSAITKILKIILKEKILNIIVYDYYGIILKDYKKITKGNDDMNEILFCDYNTNSKPHICNELSKYKSNSIENFKKLDIFKEPELIIIFSECNTVNGYSPFHLKFSELWLKLFNKF